MEGLSREDLDRLQFFQQTREDAEEVYKHNPEDADVSSDPKPSIKSGLVLSLLCLFKE